MKIWHISDTHGMHYDLKVPEADCVVFSGDCSNSRDSAINFNEVSFFIDWYSNLPIKHKVFVGGNHDVSIERGLYSSSFIKEKGVVYLFNESVEIDGIKIWGSPYTPTFGVNWAWNIARHKICNVWNLIPDDTDVLVTHGPPKGILDLSIDGLNNLESCGCSNLRTKLFKLKLKACLFGHIHNSDYISNSGVLKLSNLDTIFSNASCVADKKIKEGLVSNGNLIEI
jgi:Icc-related predicted phosphoesterase